MVFCYGGPNRLMQKVRRDFIKEDSYEFKDQNSPDSEQMKDNSGNSKHGIEIGKEIFGQKQGL